MGIQLVSSSVLNVFKMPINSLGRLADHYYLSESQGLENSIGWGPNGIELYGTVRMTPQEVERLEKFLLASQYSIATHNCEYFSNYVLYGLQLSTQSDVWWKCLGANVISLLQPTQSTRENSSEFVCQQISEYLQENLRQTKIKRANEERIRFWAERGINVK